MRYVTYNQGGQLTGAYMQPLLEAHAANHIEVTPEQYANWTGLIVEDVHAAVLRLVPVPAPSEAATLVTARAALVAQIDSDTDAIYQQVIGNRAAEYTVAEAEALAYAAASYAGTVPASVSSWATAKGWTAHQAADDIIATAAAWRSAQAAIRAARLLRKEQARTAASLVDLSNVRAQWVGFVAAIRGQLGL